MGGTWRILVDTGGTFTDCVAVDPSGGLRHAKVLSTGALRGTVESVEGPRRLRVRIGAPLPDGFLRGFLLRVLGGPAGGAVPVAGSGPGGLVELKGPVPAGAVPGAVFEAAGPEEAPVLAARLVTGTPPGRPLPPLAMRLATTRGTNALLERRHAPTALFTTEGFGDLLAIGTQQRPDLFALRVVKPAPLAAAVAEVPGRLDALGREVRPLDEPAVRRAARRLRSEGISVAAVALLHSWRDPVHERRVRAILLEEGFAAVSASADLAPLLGVLDRAGTAVADAALGPAVRGHLGAVERGLGGGTLHAMTSAGGLVRAADFRAKDSLLSGPAGGVVGMAAAGRAAGFERLIGFDMGGTSTDVARFGGELEYVFEHGVGGVRLLAPALAVESVAAGGGSVCRVEGGRLVVGPESAGALPGPACYGAGGPLTLTDVNLLLGRLDPGRFAVPLDPAAARAALDRVVADLAAAATTAAAGGGQPPDPDAVLEGFLAVADERMAGALRAVSTRRGYDPADHALVAFGGAGGQHACAVAELLGIPAVVVPPEAGLLSARGLASAVVERFAERQVLRPLAEAGPDLPRLLGALGEEASRAVEAEGVPPGAVRVRRRILEMRFLGQDATLAVDLPEGADAAAAFLDRYGAVFGDRPEGRGIEVVAARVVASALPEPAPSPPAPPPGPMPEPSGRGRVRFRGRELETPRWDRERLPSGGRIEGPALVLEEYGATVVPGGWGLEVHPGGALVLRRRAAGAGFGAEVPGRPAAAERELFTHRFESVAREMGESLRRTAVSTNVKERLDFSCALLDRAGRLVVNAPHIPVHLGSLGACVRSVAAALPLGPGDLAVTNHPSFGGSHLPDVTVLAPVHDGDGTGAGSLLGFVAARAHHAEIGGVAPGSMPPAARCLAEEGVVIPPMLAVRAGAPRWEAVRRVLLEAPFPTRAVEDNLADLRAAAAACRRGAEMLRALAAVNGRETIARRMAELQDHAASLAGAALARLGDGTFEAEERLDDGTPLRVRVEVRGPRAVVDFAGSGPVHPGSLNATPAVVTSAVLYTLRLLVDAPLPLNEGLLRAVEVRIPRGFLNPEFPADPRRAPAIVGGNVETSQRVVDALLRALRVCAGSQGTMNNVAFGSARFGYYETVGGGCGAGPGFDGASAVHSHMTNTKITDAEVLEQRYPVRVERFAVRRGSGGAGRWRGGDGIVREYRFLEPVSLSVLAERRREGPRGMEGGEDGAVGRQRVVRADGTVQEIPGAAAVEMRAGDRLVLETPGGGGWGKSITP
jgi:5-oxoprolinase (ATP-hydrolysing)